MKDAFLKKGISFKFDDRDTERPGWKFAEYELKGVPVRIALGPRDLEKNQAEVARRDTKEKMFMGLDELPDHVEKLLEEIQQNIYNKALNFREENTREVETYDEFKKVIKEQGGFVLAHWDGSAETEEKIKNDTKATLRCIPLEKTGGEGKCIVTGKASKQKVIFAKAY
jgi:prolyl-tRNA synthetase